MRQVMCSETIISKGTIHHAFIQFRNIRHSGVYTNVSNKYKKLTMNKLIVLLPLILFISCGQAKTTNKKDKLALTESNNTDTIKYLQLSNKAVLLGSDLKLLDKNYKIIKDISNFNGKIIEITAVSKYYQKLKPTDDFCEDFKYVKVKSKEFEGIVDGRRVYATIESDQNRTIEIGQNKIVLTVTRNFGIGVTNEEGLTGCTVYSPILLQDKSSDYEGLIEMVKNKLNDSHLVYYPYYELKDDDGATDKIETIENKDNKIILAIKRIYQEGSAKLLVQIRKDDKGQFIAEILKNEQIEE